MTDDEFFTATTQLQTIRQWARARYAAPWAVFGAVLLRVAASTEPTVQLPGVIGGRASLNLLCAFVSASGGGKGISDKVARLAWPTDIIERPIGSGEGLAATFMPPKGDDDKKGDEDKTVNRKRVTRAIVNVPEIDTLAGLASRQGSILLAQLKSVAMGEQIGQANASAATTRIVEAHKYRLCMSVGAQPGHTGVIFDDTTGGTPQRFLWFPTTDPTMPADAVDDPAPLNVDLPLWCPGEDGVVEITYGPTEIREQIIAAHLARQRGQADALDGHAMLTRCKVAAMLAVLHHRSVVDELDWELSSVVMERSDATRAWIVGEAKRAARAKIRERAMAKARGEEFIADRKLDRAKAAILRWLERDGELSKRDLRPKLKADIRDQFTTALAELTADGLILEREVPNGSKYRLSQVHAVPEVQPLSSQVRHAVPEVQRVPLPATEPDTNPHKSDSKGEPMQPQLKPDKRHRGRLCQCGMTLPVANTAGLCEDCADGTSAFVNPPKTEWKLCAVCQQKMNDDADEKAGVHAHCAARKAAS
ncbi:hypothetical protein HH308_18080 [Gordonia sp. TBRC 11910]|uniref:DUF3987 domain-containing protein n=1 Tax=Gordonia asplenii TaxID=2725283 RepID=A0A848KWA6_9ACTN|nr:hypothetical protein [Gordonia asplenii]NMO03124.1 hypothetical protein [Gordonia asplenii]